jgi:nucleoside-diphosphate-sugar epimerase
MNVLIVGCGYIGVAIGADLVRRGHVVWGLRRTDRANTQLVAAGIRPLIADVLNPGSLPSLNDGYDWVVHCVSASGGDPTDYEKTYVEGTRHLISWLSQKPPTRLVYTSSTGVYGNQDGGWVDETSPPNPITETGRILIKAEALLLEAAKVKGLPAVILRVAGIYGPERSYWLEQVLAGTAGIDGAGERILNMVHQLDVAGAILAALERAETGEIYNVVDDEPVKQGIFLKWLAQYLGRPVPELQTVPPLSSRKRGLTSKCVSNRKLRERLGYRFRFPTFREGYTSLVKGPV